MSVSLSRRRLLVLGLGVGAGAALAACGGNAPPAAAPTQPAAATQAPAATQGAATTPAAAAANATPAQQAQAPGAAELRLMRFAGVGWEQDVKFADEFAQKNPNIKVKGEDTPYGQMNQKVLTTGASGTIGDLFPGHTRWIAFWEYKGICHELDPLIKTYPDETKFDDFFPSVIKDARGPGAEGKLYLFPTIVHPGGNAVVLINLDLVDKAGLKAPTSSEWTVQQLEELARGAGKPKDGIFGLEATMSSPLYSTQITRSWSSAAGPPASSDSWVLSPDGKKSQLGSTPVKTSFEWYWKLVKDGFSPTSDVQPPGQGLDLFTAGKEVMQSATIGQPQADHDVIKDKFKWTAVLWPKGPNGCRGSCLSYNSWSISAKTQHPDEAFHLMNALTSTDTGFWAGYEGHANPYCRRSIWTNPKLWERYPVTKDGSAWFEQGIDPFPMPANLRAQEYQDAFIQQTQKYLDAKETWDDMYPRTQKAMQDILDQPRP
jgi:multiple sugar transport system substrate-binding protein